MENIHISKIITISVGETPTDSINNQQLVFLQVSVSPNCLFRLVRHRPIVLIKQKIRSNGFGFFILLKLKNYLITPNSLPTLVKAAMALSKSSRSCPALICTRIRALPFATTG